MKYLFSELVLGDEGLLKGPFGSDLKKSLYVPKGKDTYKVYLQENILKESNTAGTHYISKQYFESSMYRYQVHENDFIVTCDGTLGEIFQIKGVFEDGIISSSLLRISLNPDLVDYDYFYYYFKLVLKKVLIKQGNNSVLKHLPGIEVIRNVPIDLPSISTQKAIGFILKTIDDKKKKNELIISELEAMAKDIYDYWFVQFDFPDENGKPYKSSGGKMVWNEELKREIPEGWKCGPLQNICNIHRGASPRPIDSYMDVSKKGIPWVKISDATCDSSPFLIQTKEYIKPEGVKKSVIVYPGTLIVSNSATPGIPKFMDIDACVHDGWLVIDGYRSSYRYYLYYLMQNIRNSLLNIASGSVFKNLKTDYLKEYLCFVPSEEILIKFDNTIAPIMNLLLNMLRETKELASLRDFLLPLLMNGQVKIGDVSG